MTQHLSPMTVGATAVLPGQVPPRRSTTASPSRSDMAWQELVNGNARFLAGQPLHPGQDAASRAERSDSPFALVFGCSDSRVAAEIIFDQGLGDLFVVRTLGHVVDAGVLGSVEYGVAVLKIPLVVVLGHDQCGAIATAGAALRTGGETLGYIRDVVERIAPSVLAVQRRHQPPDLSAEVPIDDVEAEHVRGTARLLVDKSRIVGDAVERGTCLVLGAAYQLADGHVRLITRGI